MSEPNTEAGLWVGEPGDVPPWMVEIEWEWDDYDRAVIPDRRGQALPDSPADLPLYALRPTPPEETR